MNNNSVSPKGAPIRLPFAGPPLPGILLRQTSPSAAMTNNAYSPATKTLHPPLSPPKPPSDYLLHLVPQLRPSNNPPLPMPPFPKPNNANQQCTFMPQPQRQFLENHSSEIQENREFRSTTDIRNAMSNPQAFSQAARSKGFSDFNPRFNSQIEARDIRNAEYQQPRSPKEIVNIEQVRRVSQYKEGTHATDKKSNRSSSQHNIHITIQSSIEGEQAPTITISPNGKSKHVESNFQGQASINPIPMQRVVSFPPQQSITALQRPTNITQTIVSQQAPVHFSPQPVIVNQPPTIISHHPIFIQPPINSNPQSQTELSPNHKQSLNQNTLATYSNNSQPMNPNLTNETLLRDRASSLSIGELNRQKSKKISMETAARQEYYNELPEKEDEEELSASNGCENRTTGFSAYITEEKMLMNTRRLIDQIFENETHRALLQMRVVEAKSRERVMERRSDSKSFKKSRL